MHIKAVDDTGHDRNALLKIKFLESIDLEIGRFIDHLAENERSTSNRVSAFSSNLLPADRHAYIRI